MTTELADLTTPISVQEAAERAGEVLKRGQRLGRAVLLFIVCRSEITRAEGDALLTRKLQSAGLEVARVDLSATENSDWVADLFHDPPERDEVLFLYDIGKGSPDLLKSLNYRREILSELNVLAVFWVNERELGSIAEFAPDFFRFRTEILELTAIPPPKHIPEIVRGIIYTSASKESFASLQEIQARIALRERLLADLRQDPSARALRAELKKNLGDLYQAAYIYQGDHEHLEKAIRLYHDALAVISEDRLRSVAFNDLSSAYLNRYRREGTPEDLENAIDYYDQALEIARKIGDRQAESNALGNLGNAYFWLGKVQRAIGFYEQQLVIARDIGDRRGEGNALGNLGNAYFQLGEVRSTIDYYEQALAIDREIGDRQREARTLGNLGIAYAELGDSTRALPLAQEAARILGRIGSPYAQRAQQLVAQLQGRDSPAGL